MLAKERDDPGLLYTISQNVAQVVVNLIDFNMNMQQAIDSPKLAFFNENNVLVTEDDITTSIVSVLEKRGHHIDNEHRDHYLDLSGKIGNVMGVKISHRKDSLSYDVGVDKRSKGEKSFEIGVDKKEETDGLQPVSFLRLNKMGEKRRSCLICEGRVWALP